MENQNKQELTEEDYITMFKSLKKYTDLKRLIKELNSVYTASGWDFKMKRRDLEAIHFIKENGSVRYFISDNVSTGLSKPENLHRSMDLLIYNF